MRDLQHEEDGQSKRKRARGEGERQRKRERDRERWTEQINNEGKYERALEK